MVARLTGEHYPTLVDGSPVESVPVTDRAFQFGHSLFETFLVLPQQGPLHWLAHWTRLEQGCHRLGLHPPLAEWVENDLGVILEAIGSHPAVARLTLSAGDSLGGYAPAPGPVRRVLSCRPYPAARLRTWQVGGIRVGFARTALARQPMLAGMKHGSRLESVLAAAELAESGFDELLMFDTEGLLIEAVSHNVFLVDAAGVLHTPVLDMCGVAGVMRNAVIEHAREAGRSVQVRALTLADVDAACEVFVCNSVAGVLPVVELGGRMLGIGDTARDLQAAFPRWDAAAWETLA